MRFTKDSPLKLVVKRAFKQSHYSRRGYGSITHFLECGHYVVTKQSYGNPERMRCRDCPSIEECVNCGRKGQHSLAACVGGS